MYVRAWPKMSGEINGTLTMAKSGPQLGRSKGQDSRYLHRLTQN